jgi:hypothetical protein
MKTWTGTETVRERMFSGATAELHCEAAIEIGGQRLAPDESKAYVEFQISRGLALRGGRVVRTAYGTAMHASTVFNSHRSMLHQVFNLGHLMRAYDKSPERDQIKRDYILGSIVAVEFPKTPAGGWRIFNEDKESVPAIRAVAVVHKMAERVPKVLGEHQAGRHRWTVSQEVLFSAINSGFVIEGRADAKKAQRDLMEQHSPDEFGRLGLGYVPAVEAPEDLLECYSIEKKRVQGAWGNCPVTLMKEGLDGQVHYQGVGLVRYGAEYEAQIQQLLASNPDAVDDEDAIEIQAILEVLKKSVEDGKKVLTSLVKPVQAGL